MGKTSGFEGGLMPEVVGIGQLTVQISVKGVGFAP